MRINTTNFIPTLSSIASPETLERVKTYSKPVLIGVQILGAAALATYAPGYYFLVTSVSIGFSAHRAIKSIYESKDASTIQKTIGFSLMLFGVGAMGALLALTPYLGRNLLRSIDKLDPGNFLEYSMLLTGLLGNLP